MDRYTETELVIKVLSTATSEQLAKYKISADPSGGFTSYRYDLNNTSIALPSARIFKKLNGPSFGTHLGGGASLMVLTKSNKVLIDAENASMDTLCDAFDEEPSEEMLFQASLVLQPESLQRLLAYSRLRWVGVSFFLNWSDGKYNNFKKAVLNCGRSYGIISK